ncbi:MAG: hypothetical protein GY943_04860, partial [Chloroflexi bacterium]|nr:hypothetical protein [Chloroflexota bacterium]
DSVEGAPIGYDVRGNLLTDGSSVYTYDILNRQTSVDNGNGTTEYVYDARGRRVAKINGGSSTHFIYDTQYRVIEERNNSETVTATYTYGQGMDEPLAMERSGQTYYYHRDALGSITEVSNSSGTIVERYEYDVYGTATIYDSSDTVLTATAIGNPYLYTARRYDPESGNYYYRARIYSPDLGRFLSEDPLGFDAGDYNLYRYVFNNPTNNVDPTGEFAFLPFLLQASAEAAVDALLQMGINYFVDPEVTTIEEAIQSIDLRQVGVAFITGLIPGGRFVKSAAAAVGTVIINYLDALSNCEVYTPEQAVFDFFLSMGLELAGEAFVGAVAKFGKNAVAFGLRHAGFDELADRILRNAADAVDDKVDDAIDAPSINCNSFSADTVVTTEDGMKAISSLTEGDVVLAYNEETGELGYYPIIATISHEDPVVQLLIIDSETIVTTPNHPFYTTDSTWVPAGQLHIGDTIQQADGQLGVVEASTFTYSPQPMYNFTVGTAHTYFVGDGQWLVHNAGVGCDLIPSDRQKHILHGDSTGGGHLWPGKPGHTPFPQSWDADKILDEVADIATDPSTRWYAQTGNGGMHTKGGDPAIWRAWERRGGEQIRVVFEPATGRVITAFPDPNPPKGIPIN